MDPQPASCLAPTPSPDENEARLATARRLREEAGRCRQRAQYAAEYGARDRHLGHLLLAGISDRVMLLYLQDARELDALADDLVRS